MATAIRDIDTMPPAHLNSDAAKFYEVVDGQIVDNPPMGARESILASFLQGLMHPFTRSNRLGQMATETLFLLDRARKLKRRPDVAFVSARGWSLEREVPDKESWDVVPDLAVEVISKTNPANAVASKIGGVLSGRSERGMGYLSRHEQDLRLRLTDARSHPATGGRTRR